MARVLNQNGEGLHFTCRHGVRNYWLAVRLRSEALGIAYLQALVHAPPDARGPDHARTAVPGAISPLEFSRAARLLRFVVEYAQTAGLAELEKAALRSAKHAVRALVKEQERLQGALRHPLSLPRDASRNGSESHSEQIVRWLLELAENEYSKPITLQECAARLGMNAAYLSALFSRTIAVPFKMHLTNVRMARARELLSNPARHLSEIAVAVGYASENRFRIAFKKSAGISPRSWRETMRVNPSALA